MNWCCNEEIVWSNITINSDCIVKLIIKSSSLSRIWSARVSLCDRLVSCLFLLPLSPLSWLLLHILLLIGGMHVGRGRIRRLRGRKRGGASLFFPNLHQKLDLLEQVIVVVGIKTTSQLEQSLSFFLSQLSQKLVHKSFVVNFLHFKIGRLILNFGNFVRLIDESLQELLGLLVRWIICCVQIWIQVFINNTVNLQVLLLSRLSICLGFTVDGSSFERLFVFKSKIQHERRHEHYRDQHIIHCEQVPSSHYEYYTVQTCYEKGTALLEIVLSLICLRLPDILTKREKGNREYRKVSWGQWENL